MRGEAGADAHAAQARANRRGIAAMVCAMGCFVANDALVKYTSQSLPAGQLVLLRGLIATTLVLAVAVATGALPRLREIARGPVLARTAVDAVSTLLFLFALFHMPLPTAAAINMASPLIVTALAAGLLGERLRLPATLATAAGFVGVVLIIQPQSDGFNVYAIVCLFATFLMSVRDLLTRRLPPRVPSILVTLANAAAVTVLAGLMSLAETWAPIRPTELGLVAVAAGFLSVAYFLLVFSTRRGNLSIVAPFRYTALLYATVIGYAVWGDAPNALAWCGIALVVGSGILVLRASRRARTAEPSLD